MAWAAFGERNNLPTFFHGLISNKFSHLILKLFCGAKERDCIYTVFICTDRERRVQRRVPTLPKTTEVLPLLNLTPLESEEVAHTQSGIWCPLLCLLKFCGWAGKQYVGLVDIFLLRKCTTVGKLCLLFIKSEIPKGKRPHLPSLLCLMPNTLWMVNKCHIIFTLHWVRMTFSQESCLLQQTSQSVYISQEKGTV